MRVQKRAIEQTGATLIGSAVHLAGHPLLERDQNVVLALIEPNLNIYSYENDQPLVIIPLQEIISVKTVVYDDERIPHVDAVDSAAQAIQLALEYEGYEVACIFRSMKKVRPIDWYHAVQRSRINTQNKSG